MSEWEMQYKQYLQRLRQGRAKQDTMNRSGNQPHNPSDLPMPGSTGYHLIEQRTTHTIQHFMAPDDERRRKMQQKLMQQKEQIMFQQKQYEQRQGGPGYPSMQVQVESARPLQVVTEQILPAFPVDERHSEHESSSAQNNTPVHVTSSTSSNHPTYSYRSDVSPQYTVTQDLGIMNQAVASSAQYSFNNTATQSFGASQASNFQRGLQPTQNSSTNGFPTNGQPPVSYQNSSYRQPIQHTQTVNSQTALTPNQENSISVLVDLLHCSQPIPKPDTTYNSRQSDVPSVSQGSRSVQELSRQQAFSNFVAAAQQQGPINYSYSGRHTDAHQYPKTVDATLNCGNSTLPNRPTNHNWVACGPDNPPQSSQPVPRSSYIYRAQQSDVVVLGLTRNRLQQEPPRQKPFDKQVSSGQSQASSGPGHVRLIALLNSKMINTATSCDVSVPNPPGYYNRALCGHDNAPQSFQPAPQSSGMYPPRQSDVIVPSQSRPLQVPRQQPFSNQTSINSHNQSSSSQSHVIKDLDVQPNSKSNDTAASCDVSVPNPSSYYNRALRGHDNAPQSFQPAPQSSGMYPPRQSDVIVPSQSRPLQVPRQQPFSNQTSINSHNQSSSSQSHVIKDLDVQPNSKSNDTAVNSGVSSVPNQPINYSRVTPQYSQPAPQSSAMYPPRQSEITVLSQSRPLQEPPRQQQPISNQVSTGHNQISSNHGHVRKDLDVQPHSKLSHVAVNSSVSTLPNQPTNHNRVVRGLDNTPVSSQPATQSSSFYPSSQSDVTFLSQSRRLQEPSKQQQPINNQVSTGHNQTYSNHGHVRKDMDVLPNDPAIDLLVDSLLAEYPDYFLDKDFIRKFNSYASKYRPKQVPSHT